MFNDIGSFLKWLENRGELVRVKCEVSTFLEITEIHRRTIAVGGPVVVFENVVNELGATRMPVVVNLFGTVKRIANALGVEQDCLREVGELLAFLKSPKPPSSVGLALKMLPLFRQIMSMRPKLVRSGSCQEVVLQGDDVDLRKLPVQTCWPNEPAPLITWSVVVTRGPSDSDEDNFNLGIYRLQVLNRNTTLMRWLKHRGGAQHHRRWGKVHKGDLPVAVVIGTDPATMLAAVTPVPETLSEYHFAGLLRKKSVNLVNCITVPIKVPANAEIVLEGYVSLERYGDEGPYGDHTGYYNSVERFPEFRVTAITMKRNPLYVSTFTGRAPDEPSILGEALNEIFIPLLQQQFPEIVDFWLPPEACSYRIAVVSIKKAYPGHAARIVWGVLSYLRQFLYTKFVIVVDDDINIRDWKDVVWAIATRSDPSRDLIIMQNTPVDYLDFASPKSGLGGKLGIDATNKILPETERQWGNKIYMDESVIEMVNKKWASYGLNF